METLDPVSTNVIVSTPSTTTKASLEWPISHTKWLGLWYPGSKFNLPRLLCVLDSPSLGCMSQWEGWRCLWPPVNFHLKECLDTPRPGVPLLCIKGILPYYDCIFHAKFNHCHFPMYCLSSDFHSFCYPTV